MLRWSLSALALSFSPCHSLPDAPTVSSSSPFPGLAVTSWEELRQTIPKLETTLEWNAKAEFPIIKILAFRKPAIIVGLDTDRWACREWTGQEIMRRISSGNGQLRAQVSDQRQFIYVDPHKPLKRTPSSSAQVRYLSVSEFGNITQSKGQYAYMLANPRDNAFSWMLRALAHDLRPLSRPRLSPQSPLTGGSELPKPQLWMGSPSIISILHYDASDNVFLQLHGRKEVLLFPPSLAQSLYLWPWAHPGDGHTQLDFWNMSPSSSSVLMHLAKQARRVVLGPGDMLFIPAYHLHMVYSLDPESPRAHDTANARHARGGRAQDAENAQDAQDARAGKADRVEVAAAAEDHPKTPNAELLVSLSSTYRSAPQDTMALLERVAVPIDASWEKSTKQSFILEYISTILVVLTNAATVGHIGGDKVDPDGSKGVQSAVCDTMPPLSPSVSPSLWSPLDLPQRLRVGRYHYTHEQPLASTHDIHGLKTPPGDEPNLTKLRPNPLDNGLVCKSQMAGGARARMEKAVEEATTLLLSIPSLPIRDLLLGNYVEALLVWSLGDVVSEDLMVHGLEMLQHCIQATAISQES